jgi:hypothetical protein
MNEPTIPDPVERRFDEGVDVDVVPGDPPVPITVWRTPAADTGVMSPRLAARLLAAYTRRGDAVHDATFDPEFARAVAAADRRGSAWTGRRGDPADPCALILTGWPMPTEVDPVIILGALRRRLAPAGVLVAVVANLAPGGGPVEAGPLVYAARQTRLSYLQHIVAVTAAADGDHLTPTPGDGPAPAGGAHLRVHTDLLVFTPAGSPMGSRP